ncbi:protein DETOXIFICATION 44, chloroplastic isoform X2 [Ipomoea triloba]|uniref:protein DETOXIFICATION 44, chloroplastic isoform X2 n=1 Tax=Ipomoea triloba TaxID=35885 RepID=UPI00125D81CC|nr:protein DETOXIFICATION 44, chloroplastic isoform X2 [Ipomoea triloba]
MAVASSLSQLRCRNHFSTQSLLHSTHTCFSPSPLAPLNLRNNRLSLRIRTTAKSSPNKSASILPEKAADGSKTSPDSSVISDNRVREPDPDHPSGLSLWSSASSILEGFKVDGLGREILSIALPAALALAADPIASLIDTAFVGHLGSVELAAVGVSASVFNLVSKLFNVPLLNITTSFVAEEQAVLSKGSDQPGQTYSDGGAEQKSKIILPSVSTSLALATGLGIAEAIAVSVGSSFLMNAMGIAADSPMRSPAEQFLTMRAFGAPAIVIALAAQGTFRGFKDTKTPLYAVGAGSLLNTILDPLLIFSCGFGISGAAIATVISEYLIAFILLFKLNDKVLLIAPDIDGERVVRYLKSGALLTGRTLAVFVTTTLATSLAAREGPIPMAGHQICFQVWLALSMLTDALALAGQALLASDYSQGNYTRAREVVYKVLQIGMATGLTLGVSLLLWFGALSSLFSSDSEVLEIASYGTLFVAGSQPVNAIAFVLDGLYYGVSDFEFAAYSMLLIGMISSVFLWVATPFFGLAGVWAGLFLLMALRVVAGCLRLGTRTGPWKFLWSDIERDSTDALDELSTHKKPKHE